MKIFTRPILKSNLRENRSTSRSTVSCKIKLKLKNVWKENEDSISLWQKQLKQEFWTSIYNPGLSCRSWKNLIEIKNILMYKILCDIVRNIKNCSTMFELYVKFMLRKLNLLNQQAVRKFGLIEFCGEESSLYW